MKKEDSKEFTFSIRAETTTTRLPITMHLTVDPKKPDELKIRMGRHPYLFVQSTEFMEKLSNLIEMAKQHTENEKGVQDVKTSFESTKPRKVETPNQNEKRSRRRRASCQNS